MWAAIYPGQGSQFPGMGRFLYDDFSLAKRLFEEASDALHLDMRKLCFDSSESDLALTENTQPALLLVSTITHRVLLEELGFSPKITAGHSVGEYAAVVAAGALSFTDGMRAVRQRGQAMQSAVPVGQGGMSAVMGLEPQQVFDLCKWAEEKTGLTPLQPANLNAPGQIVISGNKQILDWLPANFTSETLPGVGRVKFIPLKVSAPFHCSMMAPAEEQMREVLGAMKFSPAQFPVVQNVMAEAESAADKIRDNLVRQITAPVRWMDCVAKMRKLGAAQMVEVGCGKVLAGLVKKIDSEGLTTFNMNSIEDLKILASKLKA